MLFMAALSVAVTVLVFCLPHKVEENMLFWAVLFVLIMGAGTFTFVYYALLYLVGRIELGTQGFTYTDRLGRRHYYAYGDVKRIEYKPAVSNKVNCYIYMKDGRRIYADWRMLEKGLDDALKKSREETR